MNEKFEPSENATELLIETLEMMDHINEIPFKYATSYTIIGIINEFEEKRQYLTHLQTIVCSDHKTLPENWQISLKQSELFMVEFSKLCYVIKQDIEGSGADYMTSYEDLTARIFKFFIHFADFPTQQEINQMFDIHGDQPTTHINVSNSTRDVDEIKTQIKNPIIKELRQPEFLDENQIPIVSKANQFQIAENQNQAAFDKTNEYEKSKVDMIEVSFNVHSLIPIVFKNQSRAFFIPSQDPLFEFANQATASKFVINFHLRQVHYTESSFMSRRSKKGIEPQNFSINISIKLFGDFIEDYFEKC